MGSLFGALLPPPLPGYSLPSRPNGQPDSRQRSLVDLSRSLWQAHNRPGKEACCEAGEGNRTLVFSLEGCCSTIELHPQPTQALLSFLPIKPRNFSVGGTGFEPVKAMPTDLQSVPFDRSGNPPTYPLFEASETGGFGNPSKTAMIRPKSASNVGLTS